MTPESKCTACGSFKPRLNLESEALQNLRLLSEYDPSALEEIKETIALIAKDYQECASEITRLQLRQEQSKLCVMKLQSLLGPSPTQKLPNEVLMYIFNYVSRNNLFRRTYHRDLVDMPALVLSSVCSRWRQITLSYSILWSRISLFITMSDSELALLERYIERSGHSLLRVTIRVGYHDEIDAASPVLLSLGQHCHRWQYLCLIGGGSFIEAFIEAVHEFPMLEELESHYVDAISLEIYKRAPKLRSLIIKNHLKSQIFVPFVASSFPLLQLTSLDVLFDVEFAKVADYCPNLISLRFRLRCLGQSPLSNSARPFKSLRSLSFFVEVVLFTRQDSDIDVLNVVLSSFSCPSLTSLTVEWSDEIELICNWPLDALESFLVRSSCVLTSLSIQGLRLSDNDLVTVFRRVSSLTSLIIKDHRSMASGTFTPAMIQSLHTITSGTLHTSSTPLLPKLRHLSLAYAGEVFDDAGFVDMIVSRCLLDADAHRQGIEPLRSLVLKSLHRTSNVLEGVADIYKPLQRLEEAGFRIVIEGLLDTK